MNELYDTCKRWDEVAASVPEVVERLHTLRSLHEQGAQFGKSMTHIDTVQQQLRDQLATQTVTLNTVWSVRGLLMLLALLQHINMPDRHVTDPPPPNSVSAHHAHHARTLPGGGVVQKEFGNHRSQFCFH